MKIDQGVKGFKKVTLSNDEVDCLSHGYDVHGNGFHITTEENVQPVTVVGSNAVKTTVTLGSLGQGMTPNDLEILIHFYVSPASHPRASSIAVESSCSRLVRLGILNETQKAEYSITQKGKAWMRCILDTPFPKNIWLDDNGHIIDINED